MCVHAYYGMNTENQGQFVGVCLYSSIWFPGVELRLSVLVGSVFTLWVISYPEVWINTDGGWVSWSTVPVAPLILRVDLPLWDPTQPHSHPPLAMSSAPPQTYLWSFPSSFKIKIIFLSTCVCVHAHTSEYRHNIYVCQRICVEVIEKNQVSVLAFHLAQHGFLFSAVNARLADPQHPRILMPLPFILPWEWCDYRCVLLCLALCG